MWIHIDTYVYIIWIHMGAQEPGSSPKLAAGPGPWARVRAPGPWGPASSFGPGPGSWAPICIHSMYSYVPMCIHMYPHIYKYIYTYVYINIYPYTYILYPYCFQMDVHMDSPIFIWYCFVWN